MITIRWGLFFLRIDQTSTYTSGISAILSQMEEFSVFPPTQVFAPRTLDFFFKEPIVLDFSGWVGIDDQFR
ncbi:unnamed protein product [Haemonchus placei]|uniref:Uncharacterized protein n=1 Tax=Haemonchus placei TaxID=6290 RepID=A0A3P7VPF4_HAEPC|nr:unnamed protein product [Haemonchus placei]